MSQSASNPQGTETERSICDRARSGDESALGELVALYWTRLKLWALWEIGDMSLADDACQETWVRLTLNIDTLDPDLMQALRAQGYLVGEDGS